MGLKLLLADMALQDLGSIVVVGMGFGLGMGFVPVHSRVGFVGRLVDSRAGSVDSRVGLEGTHRFAHRLVQMPVVPDYCNRRMVVAVQYKKMGLCYKVAISMGLVPVDHRLGSGALVLARAYNSTCPVHNSSSHNQ
jgi:hypothetical protein